ncbi:MAG: single-stranded DNA-binding protein [Butyricicoccus sp.]
MSSISINNCVFMGRLTGEPEMRYTRSNKPVTTFRIAVSRRSSADVTDFIPCVTYGAQAEFVSQWFQKGTLAIVIGQLTSHMWVDKNTGKTRVDYEIQCDNVQFGETKKQRIAREQEQPPQAAEPEATPVSEASPIPQAAPQSGPERSGLQIVAVDTLTGNVSLTPSTTSIRWTVQQSACITAPMQTALHQLSVCPQVIILSLK